MASPGKRIELARPEDVRANIVKYIRDTTHLVHLANMIENGFDLDPHRARNRNIPDPKEPA